MTEVQKYQGQFLEKKRQEKADQKTKKKVESVKSESEEDKSKGSDAEEETPKISSRISKHLGEGNEFQGWKKTCISLLKSKSSNSLNKKKMLKKLWKVYQASK